MQQFKSFNEEDGKRPFDRKRVPDSVSGRICIYQARRSGSSGWGHIMKTLTINKGEDVTVARDEFLREIEVFRQAQSHHVVELTKAFELRDEESERIELAIVMPKADTDLEEYLLAPLLDKKEKQRQKQIYPWFHCLANAVDFIHGVGIRHRDIKPKNILVHGGKILLADFGISSMGLLATLSTTIPQLGKPRTITHCAPEVEGGSSRGRSADIFSLGAVFLDMIATEQSKTLELNNLKSNSYAKNLQNIHLWIDSARKNIAANSSDSWRLEILSLCQRMLDNERDQRPLASDVLQSLQFLSKASETDSLSCGCINSVVMEPSALLVEKCKRGSLAEVKDIVEMPTNPSAIGALHQASARGALDIVTYLVREGADKNLQDFSGQTALHCAAGFGHEEIVQFLIQNQAAIDRADQEGRTPLHSAAGCGRLGIVETLLDRAQELGNIRSVIEAVNTYGQTALHLAAKRGHDGAVKLILEALTQDSGDTKRHVNAADKKGRTALHDAVGNNSTKLARRLFDYEADANVQDTEGRTPLHFSVLAARSEECIRDMVTLLIEKRADVTIRDVLENRKACHYAQGKPDIQTLLNDEEDRRQNETKTYISHPSTTEQSDTPQESTIAGFHADFISFITIAQSASVSFMPVEWKWDSRLDPLGAGATGDVRSYTRGLNSNLAVKRFTTYRQTAQSNHQPHDRTSLYFENTESLYRAMISELVILSLPATRSHQNIIDIRGVGFDVQDDGHGSFDVWPVLIMDAAPQGNLMSCRAPGEPLMNDIASRLRACAQIGSAISTLHSQDIVHGDIKPQNVLIYGEGESICAKLSDFSYSRFGKSEGDLIRLPQSKPWHAPEYVSAQIKIRDAKLMDIYSFGLLCFWTLWPEGFQDKVREFEVTQAGGSRTSIQDEAKRMVYEALTLESSMKQQLEQFFDITLSHTPAHRLRQGLNETLKLLVKDLPLPDDRPVNEDEEEHLDLTDPSEFSDMFRHLRLITSGYDMMQDLQDLTRRREYMEFLREKHSTGSKPWLRNESFLDHVKHYSLSVLHAVFSLTKMDYRVRAYIAKYLEDRALNSQCERCKGFAAFEVAVCYKIGFGVDIDEKKVEEWLRDSDRSQLDLDGQLDYIRGLSRSGNESLDHTRMECFSPSVSQRYGERNLARAQQYLIQEISELKKAFGDGHWLIFPLRTELIQILAAQEQTDQAINEAKELDKDMRDSLGASHSLRLHTTITLAELHSKQYQWEDAVTILQATKSASMRDLGTDHLLTLRTIGLLAEVLMSQGKYEEADAEFCSISKMAETSEGARKVYTTEVAIHHCTLLEMRREYNRAESIRVTTITQKGQSSEVSKLLINGNQGYYAFRRGEFTLAESMLEKVVKRAEYVFETDNSSGHSILLYISMMSQRNLALAIRGQGRHAAAESLQRKLLLQRERHENKISHETLEVMFDLARTLQKQDKWAEAEALFTRVQNHRVELLGQAHKDTLLCSQRLYEVLRDQNKLSEAQTELRSILATSSDGTPKGLHREPRRWFFKTFKPVVHVRDLTEEEQIQIAMDRSLRALDEHLKSATGEGKPEQEEEQEDDEDEDDEELLKRAIQMSLERDEDQNKFSEECI